MAKDLPDLDKIPLPHNIEAEQALLGAIVMNNDVYAKVSGVLRAEHFYEAVHREIYEVIEHLIGERKVANPVTMRDHMAEIQVEDMTGPQYLAMLAAGSMPANIALDYANVIVEDATKRALFQHYTEKREALLRNRALKVAEVIDEGEIFFADVRPKSERAEQFVSFSRAVDEAIEVASLQYGKSGALSGLSTGLDKLDDATGGLNKSDLIIVAGRPGMGKTALAVNITYTVARHLKEKRLDGQKTGVVAWFSLEMPRYQIANRIIAEHSKIASSLVRRGKLSQEKMQEFIESGQRISDLPIQIDHTGALPINQLATRIRALRKRVGVEVVIVDYLQLLKGSGAAGKGKEINRVGELTEITGALKALAKELDVPLIALSQLSRKVEERDDKRPKLADLRESGSIEQDADVVIMTYREEYYLNQSKPREAQIEALADWQLRFDRAHGRADLIIEKNRHGAGGQLEVGFNAPLMQFHNDVPEAVANDAAPREKRVKKKQLNLTAEAALGKKRLESMTITQSVENDSLVGTAPNGVKLVSYLAWKKRVAEELLDPDHTEKQAAALMERITKALAAHDLIGRGGSKLDPYVWIIPEKK